MKGEEAEGFQATCCRRGVLEEGREPLVKHLPPCMEGSGDFPALKEFLPPFCSLHSSRAAAQVSQGKEKIPGEQENTFQNKFLPLITSGRY